MSLVIVGTVAFDAIETPFGKTDKIIGGAATYAGIAASHLTKDIHLVSVVGDDFPEDFLNDLAKRGISKSGIEVKKGEKSFFWSGKYHMDMNSRDTLVTELNVLENFDPKVPAEAENAEYVLLGNIDPNLQMKVIEQFKTKPKLIVLDTMNFWMDIALEPLKAVIAKVDVLTINDEEARQLSGEYSLVKAARKILEMGPDTLVIKKGEHGALLFQNDEVFFAPALPLEEVFDPTGAGDSFAGGFIGHLAATDDLSFDNMKRAIIHGSALASFCVEAFGAERILEIQADDLKERLAQFRRLTTLNL